MNYNYPINIQIQYTNDDEYRKCITRVFHIDEDEDNEDNDEASTKILDLLFEITSVHFKELYELSSAVMMMEALDIGLVILFSYDYFSLFHLCLCDYLSINQEEEKEELIQFTNKNQYYLQLLDKFRKNEN
jgi:hypothetical protein